MSFSAHQPATRSLSAEGPPLASRRVVALAVAAVLLLSGCAGPVGAWVGSGGAPTGHGIPTPGTPTPGTPTPGTPTPGTPTPGTLRPSTTGTPPSAGTISGGGVPSSAGASNVAAAPIGWKVSDIPTFPPAPTPVPVKLPPGPAVPYLARIPTSQKVAFLTIDDGAIKTAEAPKLIAAANIPVTLFLTIDAIKDDPGYFRPMQAHGAVIEAHTITHTELPGTSYAFQRREVCGSADKLGAWYGRRPVLFRPPYGSQDGTTLRVAHDCGIRAALFWKETVDKGKVRYQEEHRVKPGDIILMHFRPAFVADFLAALRAIHRAGLTPALLEDYLPR